MKPIKEKNVFVGNLPDAFSEDDLKNLFSDLGRIMKIKIMKDIFTGKSKGFGFVEFESAKSAAMAVEKYRGHEVSDKRLKLSLSRNNSRR